MESQKDTLSMSLTMTEMRSLCRAMLTFAVAYKQLCLSVDHEALDKKQGNELAFLLRDRSGKEEGYEQT